MQLLIYRPIDLSTEFNEKYRDSIYAHDVINQGRKPPVSTTNELVAINWFYLTRFMLLHTRFKISSYTIVIAYAKIT